MMHGTSFPILAPMVLSAAPVLLGLIGFLNWVELGSTGLNWDGVGPRGFRDKGLGPGLDNKGQMMVRRGSDPKVLGGWVGGGWVVGGGWGVGGGWVGGGGGVGGGWWVGGGG